MRTVIFAAALMLAACTDDDGAGNGAVGDMAGNLNGATADNASEAPAGNATAPTKGNAAEPLATGRDLGLDLPGLGHPVGDGVRFFCFRFDEDQMTEAGYKSAAAAVDGFQPGLRDRGIGLEYRLQPAADRDLQLAQCRLEAPASVAPDQVLLIALSGTAETNLSLRRGDYALETTDRKREPAQWVEAYFNARLGRRPPTAQF